MGFASAIKAEWNFSCPDWADRLRDGRPIVPDLPLDLDEGNRAVGIFDNLRLPDVPDQPYMKDAAGDWFRDIVRAIFGSIDEHGERHVRNVFGLVPKKNSKTTGGAGIMVTALLMNKRPRAEFLLIGPTQDVADTAYQQAAGMIEADPYLAKRFHAIEHKKTIVDRLNKAKLRIKTFDMKVLTGSKPAGVLLDELHVMSSYSYASRVLGQISGGLIPNKESFLIIITTQSDEPPSGVFKSELQYARGVRDGSIKDSSTLPVLYEFPEKMQTSDRKPWKDPKNWHMVLPNLGRSITLDRLIEEWQTAQKKGEEEERRWASQHLNVEIGLALHSDRWIGADYWEAAADKRITLQYLIDECDVIVVGGDVGGLLDLWGLAAIGRHKVTRRWLLWAKAWAQPSVLTRHPEIVEKLNDFERDGDLVICKRVTQDVEEAAAIIASLRDAGKLPEVGAIGLDPNGVTALLEELAGYSIIDPMVKAVSQGYKLSASIFGIERKLADGTMKHCGSGLLTWCVQNACAEQRGSNVYIDKKTASAKIDPLVAAFNAGELMGRNPEAAGTGMDDYFKSLAGAA
ncbi:terminase large subunit [Agrobacterium tumefaciens]|uniref:Terminase large subunit n=1 Tax=Agrobacterium tumefaciens TaxID=358 RepID=A0AA44FAK9_AGRTU|nr:terminase TerL endonuclease subunit [Agrobacterium tumefaciens]NSL23489.1 terminase large subunit [Agrobacterium tumefaciens]NTB88996.1 terminase large subunit [Agrobacterium tumefaciens]NTC19157.1 terminase large subunit [Agrobacterium tumefaciens]NTC31650.1 terminase large subunit [Agrobacterium tumefaciens]NTC56330.1 terminase large subunit [Agrobacterium tumefaciens]